MSKTISVVFNADTSQFIANVDGASKSVAKAAQAVADAKNKITASYKEQMAAAKAAGASQEELAAITKRAAQMRLQAEEDAQVKLRAEQQSYLAERYSKLQAAAARETNLVRTQLEEQTRLAQSAALRQDIQRRNASPALSPLSGLASLFGQTFGPKPTEEASAITEALDGAAAAGGHLTNSTRAISGAFMELEGRLPLRALERFLATSQTLAPILEGAFPAVGAIALGAAVLKLGEESYEAYENVARLSGAIEGLNQLQITVDKSVASFGDQTEAHVEDILAKTQGRAAALQQHLQFQSNKPVDLSDYFYADAFKKLPDNVKAGYEDLYKVVAPNDVPERLAKIRSEVTQLQTALASTGNAFATVKSVNGYGPSSFEVPSDYYRARLTAAQQIQAQLSAANDTRVSGLQSVQSDVGSQQNQDAKEAARKAEEASRKAAEAARRVAEMQRQSWETQFRAFQASYMRSADEFRDFWIKIQNSHDVLPINRVFVADKVSETSTEARKSDAEGDRRWSEHDSQAAKAYFDEQHELWAAAKVRSAADERDYWELLSLTLAEESANYEWAQSKALEAAKAVNREWEEAQRARIKVAQDLAAQQASLAEKWVAMQQQTGRISRPDAVSQVADIHTALYGQQMAALQAELARQQAIDPDSAGTVEAQAAITKAAAERQLQIMQDAAAQAAATWEGALKNSLAAWVNDAEDSAKEVASLFLQTVNGINDTLASALVAKREPGERWSKQLGNAFSNTARGIGKTVANDGLKAAEAPLLKSFGLGKADGSRSNPFWVRMVEAMGGGSGKSAFGVATGMVTAGSGAASALDGLTSLFSGSNGAGDDSNAGSTATQASTGSKVAAGIIGGLGKIVGAFGGMFGGGKALGGGVQAGVEYDVGEMGREKFIPSTDGVIVPNHALGGDSAVYQISVGHGVTPTEFEMKLQQALQTYHKRVMPAGAVAAVQNHNQRSTSNRR